MFPNQFAYHQPSTLDEALTILTDDPDAKLLAGGHSLIPAMKLRLATPHSLIDLGKLERLKGIKFNGDVTIGAMTTYKELHESAEVRRAIPMLAEAAGVVGDPQVRARGTLGGSLAHADPAADLTAVFLALDGVVTAVSNEGERSISSDSFFVDLWTTDLRPNEIVVELKFPRRDGDVGSAYEKSEHPASGYAVVGVAVVLSGAENRCASARVAITGATSVATRARATEQALQGQPLSGATFDRAAALAADGLEINGDHFASMEYRAHLIHVLTRRALQRASEALGR